MPPSPKNNMNSELISLLENMDHKNKVQFLEGMSTINEEVSKRIILKAAGPHSPVTIDEFEDISETTMVRHLRLLSGAGILESTWLDDRKKYAITDFGRQISEYVKNSNIVS